MSRLSDQQWRDAFRAAGYTPEDSARFINKFKGENCNRVDATVAKGSRKSADGGDELARWNRRGGMKLKAAPDENLSRRRCRIAA
jgi:hypothetical protein